MAERSSTDCFGDEFIDEEAPTSTTRATTSTYRPKNETSEERRPRKTAIKEEQPAPKKRRAAFLIWNKRAAEILAQHGHDVTLIRLQIMPYDDSKIGVDPKVNVWKWELYAQKKYIDFFENEVPKMLFKESSIWSSPLSDNLSDMFYESCEMILKNDAMIKKLTSENFDSAFTHMFDYCPIGLIHMARIPTWIWFNSAPIFDVIAHDMGVPAPPSYIPILYTDHSDKMSFSERFNNLIAYGQMFWRYPYSTINAETELFRKHMPNFPNFHDFSRQCPLVMVNSNELYDIPRPTLHKIINVGGLGMKMSNVKNLTGDFAKIMDKAKTVVIFSFGSVVNVTNMPWEIKRDLMKAFGRFPDVEFIVRYGTKDLDEIKPKNVHLFMWLPQNDLLFNPKTKALFAHGGYNSLQEAILASKPIVIVPFFADQPRNGQVAEKYGFGYYLRKNQLDEDHIYKALNAVLYDESYTKSAKLMNKMVHKRPVDSEQTFIRWTEFLAEFKELPNLAPYGAKMTFVEYWNLDIFMVILFVCVVVIWVLYRVVRIFVNYAKRICRGKQKVQ